MHALHPSSIFFHTVHAARWSGPLLINTSTASVNTTGDTECYVLAMIAAVLYKCHYRLIDPLLSTSEILFAAIGWIAMKVCTVQYICGFLCPAG